MLGDHSKDRAEIRRSAFEPIAHLLNREESPGFDFQRRPFASPIVHATEDFDELVPRTLRARQLADFFERAGDFEFLLKLTRSGLFVRLSGINMACGAGVP